VTNWPAKTKYRFGMKTALFPRDIYPFSDVISVLLREPMPSLMELRRRFEPKDTGPVRSNSDEMLVKDARGSQRPAQIVEQKLFKLLHQGTPRRSLRGKAK